MNSRSSCQNYLVLGDRQTDFSQTKTGDENVFIARLTLLLRRVCTEPEDPAGKEYY
jgi:hypothetical protein